MWKARRGPAGTRSRAVEEIAEMGPLPRQGESVLRVSALPRAEAGSMHCLTADGSAGLSMMAELVEQYVLEEAHRDPGLIEAGMDGHQRRGLAAIATELDVLLATRTSAGPGDGRSRHVREPRGMDPRKHRAEINRASQQRDGRQRGLIGPRAQVQRRADLTHRRAQDGMLTTTASLDPGSQVGESLRMFEQPFMEAQHHRASNHAQADQQATVAIHADAHRRQAASQFRQAHWNNREPMRRSVAPSAMARAKSPDMPMLRRVSPCR